jgi:hypothetical protein
MGALDIVAMVVMVAMVAFVVGMNFAKAGVITG